MGASGSVVRLESIPAEEIAKFVCSLGKEYKVYKAVIEEKAISGGKLANLSTQEEILELLKTLGIKNSTHQKTLAAHLLKLISSFKVSGAGGGGVDTSSHFSADGISLNAIHEFLMVCGGREALRGMTTKEVSQRFVKSKTNRGNTSYTDLLKAQKGAGVGTAQVYVSHSWSMVFLDLVDTLDNNFDRSTTAVAPFLWLDVFCYNSHIAEGGFEAWSKLIRTALTCLPRMVVAVSPWNRPTSFSRAWCIYEIFCGMSQNKEIDFIMSKAEEDLFIDSILDDFEVFVQLTADVDANSIHCHNGADKAHIIQAISKAGSTTHELGAVNKLCYDRLREWAIGTLKKAVAVADEETKLDLSITLGAIFRDAGRYAEAEPMLKHCLDQMSAQLGPENPDTLAAMNNLATIYECEGKYDLAEPLLQNCLSVSSRILGIDDPISMTVSSSLADLYSTQKKYTQAEPLYLTCVQTSTAKLGATHPDTLTSKNNLAYLYINQNRLEEAENLLTSCVEDRTRELGADHLDTLSSLHNLAYLYKSQRKYAAAEPIYRKCLDRHRIKLGDDHPNTLSSLAGLASVFEAQGRLDQAEPLYHEVTERGVAVLGESHPHVQEWKNSYDKFLRRKMALKNVHRPPGGATPRSNSRRILL